MQDSLKVLQQKRVIRQIQMRRNHIRIINSRAKMREIAKRLLKIMA